MSFNPAQPVFEQARRTPERLALFADDVELTYAELCGRAAALAATLAARGLGRGSRIGILGSRSLAAMLAVLGAAWIGATYCPLGVRWPLRRLHSVLARVRPDAIIADETGAKTLAPSVLDAVRLVVLPDEDQAHRIRAGGRSALSFEALVPGARIEPAVMGPDDLVYIVFTSGSTGEPKGVMVPAAPLAAYLDALGARKALTPDDRASQFTELTFDPAVGEIFLPWRVGASLHVVPPLNRVSPARFIREQRLTVWGSTPAFIAWMQATRLLQPGSLAGLRYTSFGGEPLTLAAVRGWQAAAPHSVIDNLYGPTEATVDCAGQRIEPGADPVVTPGRDVLAIGTPHPGTELAVLGPDREPVPPGTRGELAIAGAQLSAGYLDAPEATAARFVWIGGKRWYLTGDYALQDERGMFHVLGRMDNQIKIHGYRVELEDIEAHVRAVADTDQVVACGWPMRDGVAQGIVCFVGASRMEPDALRSALRGRLPPYMVPGTIRMLPALPLSANGKLDRNALIAALEREEAEAADRR